jgi:hypothetical protein
MVSCERELDSDKKLNNYLKITGILNNVFRPQKSLKGRRIKLYNTMGDSNETGIFLWWAGLLKYMLPPLDASCRDPSTSVCRPASSSDVVVPRSRFFLLSVSHLFVDFCDG